MKLSALQNLIKVLDSSMFYVAIKDIDKKPNNVKRELYDLVGNSLLAVEDLNQSLLVNKSSTEVDPKGSVMIVFDGWCLENGIPNADFVVSLSVSENRQSLVNMEFCELSASVYIKQHGGKKLPLFHHFIPKIALLSL